MHERFLRIYDSILPLQEDFVNSLGAAMVSRGEKTVVILVSARRMVYQNSFRILLRGTFGTLQFLASIGGESMASTRGFLLAGRAPVYRAPRRGSFHGQTKKRVRRDWSVREQLRRAERGAVAVITKERLSRRVSAGCPWGEGGSLRGGPPLAGVTPGMQPKHWHGEGVPIQR